MSESATESKKVLSQEARPKVESIADSWRKDGYALIETGVSQEFYEDAADAAFKFVSSLSEEKKKKLQRWFAGENEVDPGFLGYAEFHPTKMESGTEKAFFHYHPEVKKLFSEELADLPEAERFITSMDAIWQSGVAAAKAVVDDLEKTNPGMRAELLPAGMSPAFTIRFVLYKKPPEGNLLAKGHYDRSPLTLALAESSPGLRVRDSEGNMSVINRRDETAVVMAGKGIERMDPSIPLSWHDAVQTIDAKVTGAPSRWVAVGQLFSGGLRLLEEKSSSSVI